MAQSNVLARYRKWLVWALLVGIVAYGGLAMWSDSQKVGHELSTFNWAFFVPVILLTLANYALRCVKWIYLLGRLDAQVSTLNAVRIFLAGLAMTISPAKAGELLKPYLVAKRSSVSMATATSALVAERLTDIIAIVCLTALSLAAIGGAKSGNHEVQLIIISGCIVFGLLILAHERSSLALISLCGKLPILGRIAPKLEELYRGMRNCLAPIPFLITTALSVVAWAFECFGYYYVFKAMGIDASLAMATFIYATGTVVGGLLAIFPGGVGPAEGSMIGLCKSMLGLSASKAMTSALMVRLATLWLGVIIGAFVLLRMSDLLEDTDLEQLKPTGSA